MRRLFFPLIAVGLLVASCSSVDSRVEALASAVNEAATSNQANWSLILADADSLSACRDDLSPRDLALTQAAIVEIVNSTVDADSVELAARAMRLWAANYAYMMERDSVKMTKAMDKIAAQNPRLAPAVVDSIYTRGLNQLDALSRAVKRVER